MNVSLKQSSIVGLTSVVFSKFALKTIYWYNVFVVVKVYRPLTDQSN